MAEKNTTAQMEGLFAGLADRTRLCLLDLMTDRRVRKTHLSAERRGAKVGYHPRK